MEDTINSKELAIIILKTKLAVFFSGFSDTTLKQISEDRDPWGLFYIDVHRIREDVLPYYNNRLLAMFRMSDFVKKIYREMDVALAKVSSLESFNSLDYFKKRRIEKIVWSAKKKFGNLQQFIEVDKKMGEALWEIAKRNGCFDA